MVDFDALVVGPLQVVFGEPVIYTPVGGGTYSISGVFDNASRHVATSDMGTEIVSYYPVLGVQLSQFAAPPKQGDQLTVLGVSKTYSVREIRPDSHGGVLLILNYIGAAK